MIHPEPRHSNLLATALAATLSFAPGASSSQTVDCVALRAAVEAAGQGADPAQTEAALRRQREEILQARDAASRTGCGDGFFDAPDSVACRTLVRRIGTLQIRLQRMQDQAARGADDDRRRDLRTRFDAQCTADRDEPSAEAFTTVPVDPDAPPGPAAKPRGNRVFCVRHCDGAHYPLADDVALDRMADMDRICQAQCPSARSSAYAGREGDVSDAMATDGSSYTALPAAFGYLRGSVEACGCRAPHQTWAEALAGAEAMLQPHEGDITITAELSAAMARPTPPPRQLAPASAKAAPVAPEKVRPRPNARPVLPAPPSDTGLTPGSRGPGPTL